MKQPARHAVHIVRRLHFLVQVAVIFLKLLHEEGQLQAQVVDGPPLLDGKIVECSLSSCIRPLCQAKSDAVVCEFLPAHIAIEKTTQVDFLLLLAFLLYVARIYIRLRREITDSCSGRLFRKSTVLREYVHRGRGICFLISRRFKYTTKNAPPRAVLSRRLNDDTKELGRPHEIAAKA